MIKQTISTLLILLIIASCNIPDTNIATFTPRYEVTNTAPGGTELVVFDTLMFTGLTENATGHSWVFGDSSTSNQQDALHVYMNSGEYYITYIAATDCGSLPLYDTITIVTRSEIIADFTFPDDTFLVGMEVPFTNTSRYYNESKWRLTESDSTTEDSPIFVFDSAGVYPVFLQVYGDLDQTTGNRPTDTITQSVTIRELKAGFEYEVFSSNQIGINHDTVRFTNTSEWARNYKWDFGEFNPPANGSSSDTATTPTFIYTDNLGSYDVQLVALFDSVFTDTLNITIQIP